MAMAKGRSMQDWKLFLESAGVDACTLLHYLIAVTDVEELRRNKECLIAQLISTTSTDVEPCVQQQSKGLEKQVVVKMNKEDENRPMISIKRKLEEEYKKEQGKKKIQKLDMSKIQDPIMEMEAQKKCKIQPKTQNSEFEEKMLSIKQKLEEEYKKEEAKKRQHKIQVIQPPTSKIQVEKKKRKLEIIRKQCAREMQKMPPLWGAPRKLSSTLKSF